MKENKTPSIADYIQQQEFDKKFNRDAAKKAKETALKNFDSKAKKIKFNTPYSKDSLFFMFDMVWEELEKKLKEKFELKIEGNDVTFTKIKELG